MEKRKEKGDKKMGAKRCAYCNGVMRCRGAGDTAGSTSWKCRNKKCGRTTWTRKIPLVPPVPLVFVDNVRRGF